MSEALYTACAAGMDEKLFFADLLPSDEIRLVVDYGAGRRPVSIAARAEGFATQAKVVLVDNRAGVLSEFDTGDWAEQDVVIDMAGIPHWAREDARKTCSLLVASSVLHEQRHAGAVADDLFSLGFTYVVVRDFCRVSGKAPAKQAGDDHSWGRVLGAVTNEGTRGHLARMAPENDYELVEAALKARWARGTDTDRELDEDYFSLASSDLSLAVEKHGYYPLHLAYRTPPAVRQILADLAIRATVPTHVEAVYYKPTKR